ncbi:O-linked N-acetylglucosamine transferase, SPINDLY family protein [Chitinimonas sp. PSY-7]|uniref:O-linked N-acetylglucosamine transferase family protein n=1 Tax=Chitinimonas sp. PSY-7 TaxID=3459088 RepID=UPI0040402F0B
MTPDELLTLAYQHFAQAAWRSADNFACMVLERYPQHAPAYLLRSQIAMERGLFDDAHHHLAQVATYAVDQSLVFWQDLAQLASKLGQHTLAYQALAQAVQITPDDAAVWHSLGVKAQTSGDHQTAVHAYQKTLALNEALPHTHNNYAALMQASGNLPTAIHHFLRATELDPTYTVAWKNYGGALQQAGQFEAALAAYTQATELQPNYAEAIAGKLYMQLHQIEWNGLGAQQDVLKTALQQNQEVYIPPLAYLALDNQPDHQLKNAQRWASQFRTPALPACPPRQRSRIRLGYLSGDFHGHATSWLTAGLFASHDRQSFEVFGYNYGQDDGSSLRERIQEGFDRFTTVNTLSQAQLAERIRADEIDILIDLKGWTRNSRCDVLAYRPAPVQLHYLAYPGTLGAPWCDYLIADTQVVPPGAVQHYQEAIAWLPNCYQINDRDRAIAPQPTRANAGLPETGFVFCCFNQHYKIQPDVFDIWMRLLHTVPGSLLWLIDTADNGKSTRLRHQATLRGIAPERLYFAPILPQAQHLARLSLADLALDTLPCNAHTTASDALWAGVPLVTCMGESFAGRVAASCLAAAGLRELITDNLADYEALAKHLALNTQALAAIRNKLAYQRLNCPLFDTQATVAALETAYKTMWQRVLAGLPPASFHVPLTA